MAQQAGHLGWPWVPLSGEMATKLETAIELLRKHDGDASKAIEEGKAIGISRRTVYRAKEAMERGGAGTLGTPGTGRDTEGGTILRVGGAEIKGEWRNRIIAVLTAPIEAYEFSTAEAFLGTLVGYRRFKEKFQLPDEFAIGDYNYVCARIVEWFLSIGELPMPSLVEGPEAMVVQGMGGKPLEEVE